MALVKNVMFICYLMVMTLMDEEKPNEWEEREKRWIIESMAKLK